MSLRSARRRLRLAVGGRDWLEGLLTTLGVVFFAGSALCIYATVVIFANFRDVELGFPAGEGFVRGMKGFGLAFFPVLSILAFLVGWSLAGESVRRALRRLRGRRGSRA